jgi:retron-type reverse transcriptase
MLLEPIYEQDFRDCSYGFRPGRSPHQALERLRNNIMYRHGRWILDLDLSNYFGTIDHRHLRAALDQRVKDGLVRRRIDKWLKAGVLEEGLRTVPDEGTPQGGVISPVLANVFLHYVLDTWFPVCGAAAAWIAMRTRSAGCSTTRKMRCASGRSWKSGWPSTA